MSPPKPHGGGGGGGAHRYSFPWAPPSGPPSVINHVPLPETGGPFNGHPTMGDWECREPKPLYPQKGNWQISAKPIQAEISPLPPYCCSAQTALSKIYSLCTAKCPVLNQLLQSTSISTHMYSVSVELTLDILLCVGIFLPHKARVLEHGYTSSGRPIHCSNC